MDNISRKFCIIRRRDGFTLVELIVVLIIIGILLALVIPSLTGYIDKAQATSCRKSRSRFIKYFVIHIFVTFFVTNCIFQHFRHILAVYYAFTRNYEQSYYNFVKKMLTEMT